MKDTSELTSPYSTVKLQQNSTGIMQNCAARVPASAILPMIVAMVGCSQSAIPERAPSFTESQPDHPATSAEVLRDIGEPDDSERELDSIQIIGSALTDDHIAAIRAITDDTKPTNPNRYLIRGIEHTAPNTATNTWQTGHAQIYQKLRFTNGKWNIEEEGGGLGEW